MISIDTEALAEAIAEAILAKLPPRPEPPATQHLLVSSTKLATMLGISKPFIDRLRSEGKIPSIQVGTRRLYEPSEVVAALRKQNGVDQ
ncbi:hypothetical protein Pla52o_48090 [Novipirellula galeiformis]|uniref:Helix-turn-helix domain-containing protein n=1 Tax=Novipirellula galeiformis TaxID=2528004 RepID=A0A5C6C6N1_9BACT|nr:helix-turn-helix domain-containing protein [Novipirellula galeiformis]TWU20290.1 hypothetical protein Pla52o_48090 [Novipirellula galeiformis]